MQKFRFLIAVFLVTIAQLFFTNIGLASFSPINEAECLVDRETSDQILTAVRNKDQNVIKSLSNCIKYNHKLVFQACLIDPSQLANADQVFRNDENFVYRLIKINPEILKYASDELRNNKNFMEEATYLSRDALQYADPRLLDNLLFMEKMIKSDSRNYIYASNRIKNMREMATKAFSDDGLLLAYATPEIKDDRKMVKIAIKSNVSAYEFASDRLKNGLEMKLLKGPKQTILPKKELEEFLQKHYVKEEKKRNVGLIIDKETKFFKNHQLINRNYITKWQRIFQFNGRYLRENLHLITAESRNNPTHWMEDLKEYPDLIQKIEKFFLNRHIDRNTIDNLSLTYLWKIKNKPLTLAFNLYLLRDSNDDELSLSYVSVTSLTAIVQKVGKKWNLTVVEVIFDSEIAANIAYENGQKEYILQDLYKINKKDKNPKLLFRVEDRFSEYFEVFAEQHGGKYKIIHRIDPLAPDYIEKKPYF